MKIIVILSLALIAFTAAKAQVYKTDSTTINKFTLAAGLSQPVILKGYNIAGAFFTKRFTFEWSHGWSLNPPLRDEQVEQNMEFEVKWTTGPGFGYRITKSFDVRLEFKAHNYDVNFKNENLKINYTGFTIGPGAYYRIYPFRKGVLRGLLIEPNIRWWPLVGSTLSDNEYKYTDINGVEQTHQAINSDIIYNMNIAWTFGRGR
jgi:hypothetical protein